MMNLIGGRKCALVLVAMTLVALRNVIGIDDATVDMIVYLALGGSGAIALEDAVGKLRAKSTPAAKK